jgi:hypothetical protein
MTRCTYYAYGIAKQPFHAYPTRRRQRGVAVDILYSVKIRTPGGEGGGGEVTKSNDAPWTVVRAERIGKYRTYTVHNRRVYVGVEFQIDVRTGYPVVIFGILCRART